MRKNLTALVNNLITLVILAEVALIPLIFTNLTTEFFEIPKMILLTGGVLLLIGLWAFSWVLQGKVTFTRTPLDLPLIILLIAVILSTLFSDSRYISIFGNFPRIHGSAIAWVAYILFYFVTVSHVRTPNQIKGIFYALLFSGVIISLVSLMSYFNIYLPLSFAQSANFTPTGSTFSSAIILALLLPVVLISIIHRRQVIPSPVAFAVAILFTVTLALLGDWKSGGDLGIFVVTLLAYGILIYTNSKEGNKSALPMLVLPLVIGFLIFILSNIPLGNNPLYQKHINFPREIQLPLSTSWQVSGQSFVKNPFLGSGPSTYLFNFTAYKPIDFNATRFWNLRFDTAFDEFLQILGTLGAVGFLAFLFLIGTIATFGISGFNNQENYFSKGLSLSIILALVALLFHVSTPVFMVSMFAILVMMMGVHKSISGKVEELSIGIKASKLTDSNLVVGDILPIIIFLPVIVLVLAGFWKLGTVVAADRYHRMALDAANKSGLQTYNDLVKAEQLNPYIDLYRTDLVQTNFALANAIAAAKGPSQASPEGSLTDQDKQAIQQFLSQAITEGRVATVISPNSAQNWEILASVYRQISGVAKNAIDFSLDAYGRAIQRDPLNPNLRLSVGGIYYSLKNYDLATRFFADAANLKPDFANAYYNLAIAFRDKGDLPDAISAAQQVVTILQSDTKNPDYKTASDFLADLKAKAATGSATQGGTPAPAAGQASALQKSNLPSVVDLGNKPSVATPSAIPSNPQTQVNPKTTIAPTATP